MRQVIQSLKTGAIEVADVPCPKVTKGKVLIRTSCSLVSAGTERMLIEFGKAGWLEKARQQPDKVRQVIEKIKTDGFLTTFEAVKNKLDQPLPLGYCNVGKVIGLGEGVSEFRIGDRVVSNGPHAEVVSVSANLCAKVPDGVVDEHAAFAVLGAIALEGVRLIEPEMGECVVVIGLGLIGLITVQLLQAHGCRVLGLDPDKNRVDLARTFGAEALQITEGVDVLAQAEAFSRGHGVDAVVITASTSSSEPVHQAAQMCRKRGRIVLVGVTGLKLSRDDFYKKELTFQVSCSYGPGRYDPDYEEKGHDYPLGFVRWTAKRNFEAVLDMMEMGKLDVSPLISHRFKIEEAQKAYELLTKEKGSLGILLQYQPEGIQHKSTITLAHDRAIKPGHAVVSFIGAGSYATGILIPAFKKSGARLRIIAANGGVSSMHAARRFNFEEATTDADHVLSDPETEAIVVATRHDSHAPMVIRALEADKHVFVEKPLCLKSEELEAIEGTLSERPHLLLMVGFNRRFSPLVKKMHSLLKNVPGPRAIIITVNAGVIPKEHWVNDPEIGGGRIMGEACHFIDLLRFLVGYRFTTWEKFELISKGSDTATLQFSFEDGSTGTVHYLSNGHRSFPKERVEVFAGGGVLQLDNFRILRGFGWSGFKSLRLWRQDKGQRACAKAFIETIEKGGSNPIPINELLEVHRITISLK